VSEKNPEDFFMSERLYHIYAKDKCLYHSLSKSEFDVKWDALTKLVEVFTDYQRKDLTFEEVVRDRQLSGESSY